MAAGRPAAVMTSSVSLWAGFALCIFSCSLVEACVCVLFSLVAVHNKPRCRSSSSDGVGDTICPHNHIHNHRMQFSPQSSFFPLLMSGLVQWTNEAFVRPPSNWVGHNNSDRRAALSLTPVPTTRWSSDLVPHFEKISNHSTLLNGNYIFYFLMCGRKQQKQKKNMSRRNDEENVVNFSIYQINHQQTRLCVEPDARMKERAPPGDDWIIHRKRFAFFLSNK